MNARVNHFVTYLRVSTAKQGRSGLGLEAQGALRAAEERRETIEGLQAERLSLTAMAARLNADSVRTSRGGKWTATAVKRTIERLA